MVPRSGVVCTSEKGKRKPDQRTVLFWWRESVSVSSLDSGEGDRQGLLQGRISKEISGSWFFCFLKKTTADPNLVLFAVIGEEDSRGRET